jgi:hypothetical protein
MRGGHVPVWSDRKRGTNGAVSVHTLLIGHQLQGQRTLVGHSAIRRFELNHLESGGANLLLDGCIELSGPGPPGNDAPQCGECENHTNKRSAAPNNHEYSIRLRPSEDAIMVEVSMPEQRTSSQFIGPLFTISTRFHHLP